ncbi:MAG: glycerate kinase [Synergistetes bacterium]|nr:glycerate kinase [Synergistota bacterium]
MVDVDLRKDLFEVVNFAIKRVLPEESVKNVIERECIDELDNLYLVAIGKAAWRMAKAAKEKLGSKIKGGVVITKYKHSLGEIEGLEIFEAGHPLPDENTLKATGKAVELVSSLGKEDKILFLVSGGGSALFELPMEGISLEDLKTVNELLLKSGADIVEMNTVRKHISKVKGGRFAQLAFPAYVYSLILSDVLGDRLDSIASGPAYPDETTYEDALRVIEKYALYEKMPPSVIEVLERGRRGEIPETPKELLNVKSVIIGSVSLACRYAVERAKELGYNTLFLTSTLSCEASEAGRFIAEILKEVKRSSNPIAPPCMIVLGGETVVHVKGNGKGGRAQELALSVAIAIRGENRIALISAGTDGTDGPTDAAGGLVDGESFNRMVSQGVNPEEALSNNDSYNALKASGDLVITGPTGTNVNDIIVGAVI